MQTQNRLLDDLARVASGALGVAAGMREEIESRLRDQFERVLGGMDLVTREEFDAVKAMAAKDLVTREEFDAVKAMAAKAREEQETLAERLAALEAQPGATAGKAAKAEKTAKKGAPKSRAKKT